ncbi:MAG: 50S ribosomal protein L11 methyltransferase [Firmicutes bacterium]|nr:50S ribosomal protein L11 methyltransferase [Bacillota bacterium]
MNWLEVFVETSSAGLEFVSGLLYGAGITGLEVSDEREFQEFLENPNREWDYVDDGLLNDKKKTGITFFVTDNANGIETLANIKSGLKAMKERENDFDLGSLLLSVKNVKDEDWANNWKKYFKPFPVGDKFVIKPSWEEFDNSGEKIVLNIDPGHVFGTGSHETTKCCIELLEEYVHKNDSVLDIGCGSGILSIAALLLGAKNAEAVDIDPEAIDVVKENAKRNGISCERLNVRAGDILEDESAIEMFSGKGFDVVAANIVADVIIALCPMTKQFIKKNGTFICSGIIDTRCKEVETALSENGFEILKISSSRDWRAIAAIYKG